MCGLSMALAGYGNYENKMSLFSWRGCKFKVFGGASWKRGSGGVGSF